MLDCLAVGLGGFIGSVARYLVSRISIDKAGAFPINTLIINVIGSFTIGLIAALVVKHSGLNPRLALFVRVGLCGGFTTFSTFALETSTLLRSGSYTSAAVYVILSLTLCVLAVFAAQRLVG